MRCFGLTADRRRCTTEAGGADKYCAEHRPGEELAGEVEGQWAPARYGLARIFFGPGPNSARQVPDPAKFDTPTWIRKGSAERVVDELLHNPDSFVRWCCAYVLRKRRDPAAIGPLWQVLDGDASSFVRQQGAVALGKIGTRDVLGPLISVLWQDADPGVRQAAAIALGNLGYPAAARHLGERLEVDQSVFVRWDCALALGQVGDGESTPFLERSAEGDASATVRAASREALEDIRRRR